MVDKSLLFMQYCCIGPSHSLKVDFAQGEPFTDSVWPGVVQHGQQDPGGGGEQHTQAGHMGPVTARQNEN